MDKSYQNYLFTEGDVNSNVYKKVSLDSDKKIFKEVTLSVENKKKQPNYQRLNERAQTCIVQQKFTNVKQFKKRLQFQMTIILKFFNQKI